MTSSSDRFVNPYQFVDVRPVVRKRPTYHDGRHLDRLYSGSMTVEWQLVSPLLLPAAHEAEGWTEGGRLVRVPGSSLRGIVRSLHETLFNGCLRILDDSFLPAHRMPAETPAEGWRLAVVLAATNGVPLSVQLCEEEVVWVDARGLQRGYPSGRPPTSGDVIEVAGLKEEGALRRWEIRRPRRVEVIRRRSDGQPADAELLPAGRQLFLVTDTTVRPGYRRANSGGCFWALGTLSESVADVTADGLRRFKIACRGSEDRRVLERADPSSQTEEKWRSRTEWAPAEWWTEQGRRTTVGNRAQATGFLFGGDVVWVQLDDDRVVDIKLSQIWRAPGRGPVRERVPGSGETSPLPCDPGAHDGAVCLSCAVFGAIDATGSRGGEGRQDAYAGHVRVASAVPDRSEKIRRIDLAPLRAPKPGSGMFYLRDDAELPVSRTPNDIASYWGSDLDRGGLRPIRGRKFYWHSQPEEQAASWQGMRPRYLASDRQRRQGSSRPADLVPASPEQPLTLTSVVTFDQLDELSLRTLMLALNPTPLLDLVPAGDRQRRLYAVHVGGCKPLGLGSARPRIAEWKVQRLDHRYTTGDTADVSSWLGSPAKIGAGLRDRVGNFTSALPTVARLLDLGGLGEWERYVSYPPGTDWDHERSDEFRNSYSFFMGARGQEYKTRSNVYHPLPRLSGSSDPTLPTTPPRKPRGAR